jgi:hypothetical protein
VRLGRLLQAVSGCPGRSAFGQKRILNDVSLMMISTCVIELTFTSAAAELCFGMGRIRMRALTVTSKLLSSVNALVLIY